VIDIFCNLEQEPGDDHPFCDMTFEIVDKRFDERCDSWRINCRADAGSVGPVGFGCEIPMTGWKEQVDGEGEDAFHSYWGHVRLTSLGSESDRLVRVMADFYGLTSPGETEGGMLTRLFRKSPKDRTFAPEIVCLAVGIASDPRNIEDDTIHTKLFFDEGTEGGRYAEVFLNVDLEAGLVALNEKDEEYRADLVHWMTMPGRVIADPLFGAGGRPH
jgi:hypothetical protein